MKEIEKLLKMTERPQDYSDEEIRQMMNDPEMRAYYELMVDAEAGFALKKNDTSKVAKRTTRYTLCSRFMKAAAIFVGILLLSGISFAAYHFTLGAGSSAGQVNESPTQDVRVSNAHQQEVTEPSTIRTFENAELQQILQELSDFYHVGVKFHNEQSRHIRLYTKWDTTAPLNQIIERLNSFEKVNICLIDNQIIAE